MHKKPALMIFPCYYLNEERVSIKERGSNRRGTKMKVDTVLETGFPIKLKEG